MSVCFVNLFYLKNVSYVCSFNRIDLMKEEGGGSVELIPGGREVQVTSQNLFDYIRRYTEYRLVKAQEKALEVSIPQNNSHMNMYIILSIP